MKNTYENKNNAIGTTKSANGRTYAKMEDGSLRDCRQSAHGGESQSAAMC